MHSRISSKSLTCWLWLFSAATAREGARADCKEYLLQLSAQAWQSDSAQLYPMHVDGVEEARKDSVWFPAATLAVSSQTVRAGMHDKNDYVIGLRR